MLKTAAVHQKKIRLECLLIPKEIINKELECLNIN